MRANWNQSNLTLTCDYSDDMWFSVESAHVLRQAFNYAKSVDYIIIEEKNHWYDCDQSYQYKHDTQTFEGFLKMLAP